MMITDFTLRNRPKNASQPQFGTSARAKFIANFNTLKGEKHREIEFAIVDQFMSKWSRYMNPKSIGKIAAAAQPVEKESAPTVKIKIGRVNYHFSKRVDIYNKLAYYSLKVLNPEGKELRSMAYDINNKQLDFIDLKVGGFLFSLKRTDDASKARVDRFGNFAKQLDSAGVFDHQDQLFKVVKASVKKLY